MTNKGDILKLFVNKQEEKISLLKYSLRSTQDYARDAPGSNISHSDTSKFQQSNLALGIQKRLIEAQETLAHLKFIKDDYEEKVRRGCLVTIKYIDMDDVHMYLIVLGEGGETIEYKSKKVTSITLNAPLAQAMLGKEVGDEIQFRNKKFEIIEIE